ncbi:FkbM family methyltransferase [Candidatus Daviesbacteria bacterium]|nr:FkbM family methyltransferase [Candidatus Daviesbacteria bacterium]
MINAFKKIKLYGLRQFISFAYSELKSIFYTQIINGSFSQNGEDLIIDKLLNYKKTGFYVDIGSYDPYRFSNTYRFYKRGWKGINIEPNVHNYKKFVTARPRDYNLNIGICAKRANLDFYNLFPDTLSTFSKIDAIKYQKIGFEIIDKSKVKVERLDKILHKFRIKKIDFLSIDTEGFEMEVLKSNNWENFNPKLVCVESFTFKRDRSKSKERMEIRRFLSKVGYKKVYANDTNIIYQSTKLSPVAPHHQSAYSKKSSNTSNRG